MLMMFATVASIFARGACRNFRVSRPRATSSSLSSSGSSKAETPAFLASSSATPR
jgi:hypothetical protein